METQEIWNDVPGYEGKYQVSNKGNVRSLLYRGKINNIVKISFCYINGYPSVKFYRNQKQKGFLVSRLVAMTFIPNPENKIQVNHKDGNPKNNNVENLEWCTPSENIQHSYDFLNRKSNFRTDNPRKGKFGKDNITSKAISQFTLEGVFIKSYDSITIAAVENGLLICGISGCCRGITKKCGGYIWRFKYLPPK